MVYDEDLAEPVRERLADEPDLTEKRMVGDPAFLVANMAVAASGQGGLLARVDPEEREALVRPRSGAAGVRGREMAGWLPVDSEALEATDELETWARCPVAYARSFPPRG